MKIKKSHIIIVVGLLLTSTLIAFKLKSNKKEVAKTVAFSQRQIEKIPVVVVAANKGAISENVVSTGIIEPSEVLMLVSETQGKIIKIYKEKGASVSAGEVIAKVDDEVLVANVLTAEANLSQNEKDVERFTRLAQENAITKRDLEKAQIGVKKAKADLVNAKKALSNTSIKAPISGYINNDFITVGQVLGGGTQVCEIVNNNTLKINIKVSEREVYKIQKGQNVSLHLTVFPDKTFTGKIASIAEKADASMKFNVEINLANNAQNHIKSGLYAEVELPIKSPENLIINKAAILGSMEKPEVFVVSNGKAIKRSIVIGQSNNSQVEVLQGLSEGEQVIVSGQLNLKDGLDIKIIK